MYTHQLPSIILTIIFISFYSPTSHSQDNYDEQINYCRNQYSCGQNIQGIGYPFHGRDRPPACGLHGFELNCEDADNITTTEIGSQTFRVLSIDQNAHTITLARIDLLDDVCPQEFVNTALNYTLFGYTHETVQFLNLSYTCPTFEIPSRNSIRCSIDGRDRNGFYLDESFWSSDRWRNLPPCETNITVPVSRTAIEEFRRSEEMTVRELLEDGFRVEYRYNVEACSACEKSDGLCWYGTNSSSHSCICNNEIHLSNCSRPVNSNAERENKIPMKVGIGVGATIFGIIVASLAFVVHLRRKKNRYAGSSYYSHGISSCPSSTRDLENAKICPGVHIFKFSELEKATNNFDSKNELGDGGFGTVYKGKLKDGRTVAVKRLYENNYKRVEQFMNEVIILARLRHQNLVSLYGCTSHQGRGLLLVYEYIPNGTVADHLHGDHAKPGSLTWTTRMSIAVETAIALAYLHASDVIHRDVKTNNILLDNNFCVKVADFGLSRLFPTDVTHVSTAPQGTPGYVDPEYHECYQLTSKSDVFSFGVVLIELISSKPAVDITRHRHEINLSNMAINKIRNDALDELVDGSLGYDSDYIVRKMINSVAELAFQCLQNEREMRPTMEEVLEVLKGIQSEDNKRKKLEELDIPGDDAVLLKTNPQILSPDSVAVTWNSSSTTSNYSG